MSIVLAIILGVVFGFVLQKAGAADPQVLITMLRLKEFHLMKAILLAIGLSSSGLFVLLAAGLIDPSHISVKSSYVGVIIGGAVLGLGWVISGFCPGTGVVALGAGRKDALSFLLGGLLGALAFTVSYGTLKASLLFATLGGKSTLAVTGNDKFQALLPGLPGIVVAGVIAAIFLTLAWKLPEKSHA
ncbi:hypothetical protein CSB45_08160 [candidate division KSB3 bacterium]|uniref:Uncharacterized protein n=1 Tax=candidate division KSB3 bacterium TaxID=2044937 RepID=A0A2G6E5Q5_9BACT|nr:MAG: hypothetical protein CSB45_08160 [candidate division KSB3 bacterium]PIE29807.1 MAG: hypothetical protein CSA57_07055 [candidate division KSB3 bacterium]